ncbi:Protein of unknown function [Cotesia congregata]|uniref:Uncharacterized protein n=1 Tax=Cotesia congregata TaxID=51543 RepID=A0A8J2MPJ9_COTCN|nr:Protein of unknown function [Cotesia congregata]
MSQICPSSSHQLAAAALAFHRARRKFSNLSEVCSRSKISQKSLSIKNNEGSCKGMITPTTTVMTATRTTLDKTGNASSKLRVSRDCCCLRNCKSAGDEHSFDEDKSNQHLGAVDAVGDSIVVGVFKMKNVTNNVDAVKETDKNEIDEFKDSLDYQFSYNAVDYNNQREAEVSSVIKRGKVYHEIKRNHCEQSNRNRKSIDRTSESIDLLYKSDTRNDDGVVDFSRKLHEWERRTRDDPLMKIQRFSPSKLSKLEQESQQQEQQFINYHEDSHTRQKKCHLHHRRNYCQRHQRHYNSISSECQEINFQKKGRCEHQRKMNKLNDYKSEEPQVFCKRCNAIRPINLKMIHTSVEDTDETGDDYEGQESVKGKGLIKHKDSMDILVEKSKNRKILGESKSKGKKVIPSWMKIDESLSCEKIPDQLTSDDATKELCCTDHRASKTCWTHTKSSLSRPNKLQLCDRFKPKSFRSQLKLINHIFT